MTAGDSSQLTKPIVAGAGKRQLHLNFYFIYLFFSNDLFLLESKHKLNPNLKVVPFKNLIVIATKLYTGCLVSRCTVWKAPIKDGSILVSVGWLER